jgi:hypothetical protein
VIFAVYFVKAISMIIVIIVVIVIMAILYGGKETEGERERGDTEGRIKGSGERKKTARDGKEAEESHGRDRGERHRRRD